MIYADYNATAPMKPAVRAAVLEAMERHGNPSSVHRYGRIARRYVEEARAALAALVNVKPAQVVFTSGGTEANNTVFGAFHPGNVATSSIEHDSVLAATKGAARLPVTVDGTVDLKAAERLMGTLAPGGLVSVMFVNNETGVIQPLAELVRLARRFKLKFHSDAVQAACRVPVDFAALDIDYLTLSAHKLGGPQGIGCLVLREGAVLESFIKGGGQEMRRRAGTENVPGIIGFGVAAQLGADDLRDMPRLHALRDDLEARLLKAGGDRAFVVGQAAARVANTLCVAMRGISSETQVASMDLAGVAVSAGSACSSGKVKASHVLKAMGFEDDVAASGLRFSIGWNTSAEDIDRCFDAWRALFDRKNNQHQTVAA